MGKKLFLKSLGSSLKFNVLRDYCVQESDKLIDELTEENILNTINYNNISNIFLKEKNFKVSVNTCLVMQRLQKENYNTIIGNC